MRKPRDRTGHTPDIVPVAIVIAALYLARDLLIPVALAVLLTFLLAPVVSRLQRLVRSRAVAVACVTLTVVTVAGLGTFAVGQRFVSLVSELPRYQETLTRKIKSIRESTKGVVADTAKSLRTMGSELGEAGGTLSPEPPSTQARGTESGIDPTGPIKVPSPVTQPALDSPQGLISSITGMIRPLLGPFATGFIVVLLLAMMLYSREAIRDRVIRIAGLRQISLTTHALEETAARVGAYLRAQSIINLVYGGVVYLGLLAIGVPEALVCGVLAGILRFVPVLGIWLGAALPAALAVATFDGWGHLGLVAALFVALELSANFVLEPWLYGSSTGISGIGVALAIIFWTWIWGAAGLVLAMPMTVCVMVFARQFPRLAMVPVLLGDEPVLSESARFYQRLLVGNEDDAAAVLRAEDATPPTIVAGGENTQASLVARLDAVVIPALGTARQELWKGSITEAQASLVSEGVRDVALDWIGERRSEAPLAAIKDRPAQVACISVNDEGDACASEVLAACLADRGFAVSAPSPNLLLSEVLAEIANGGATVVLLSTVAPSTKVHVRRLIKALQRSVPDCRIVVCLWNGASGKEDTEIAWAGVEAVVTTLGDAISAAARIIAIRKNDQQSA